MASIFEHVEVGPKIEVFALTKAYQEDSHIMKVNLSVGGKLFTSNECMFYSYYDDVRLTDLNFKFECANFQQKK